MTTHQPAALHELLREIVAYCREAGHDWSSLTEAEHHLAALQSQPAAAGVSDRVVKALLAQALFFKEGAHTVASLEADIRAILAMRPQSEPVAFAWREKGSAKPWAVCFDVSQAREADVLARTEIRYMAWADADLRPQAVPMTEVWFDGAMRLADAYADACFDQGLNQRTEDPNPETKREKLAEHLRGITAPAGGEKQA